MTRRSKPTVVTVTVLAIALLGAVVLGAAVFGILAGSDSPSDAGDPDTAAGTGADPDADSDADNSTEAAADVGYAIRAVKIQASGCGPATSVGSGTYLGDGLVLTVAHVVAGADSIEVFAHNRPGAADLGQPVAAEIAAIDISNDIAVLAVGEDTGGAAIWDELEGRAVFANAEGGDTGKFVGFDVAKAGAGETGGDQTDADRAGGDQTDSDRADAGGAGTDASIVSPARILRTVNLRITDIYNDQSGLRRGLELDAEVDPGDSGAALFDPEGRITGMIFSDSREHPSVAYATASTELEQLLDGLSADDRAPDQPCR